MNHEDVSELVHKLVEIMIDPTRSPAATKVATVEDRNSIRKEVGDQILTCVDLLCTQLSAVELEHDIKEARELYMSSIGNKEQNGAGATTSTASK